MMALCSLPRSNPGNRLRYTRQNGPYTLGMTAGLNNKLPFGTLPRLLMAWVSTEAVTFPSTCRPFLRSASQSGPCGQSRALRSSTGGPCLVWGTWENEPCSVNKTAWFPPPKFSPAWMGRSRRSAKPHHRRNGLSPASIR